MLKSSVTESGIEISRICNFMHCSEKEIQQMYQAKSLDAELLLKWSKLLGYDFFRIYTQHLILYAPPSANEKRSKKEVKKKIKNKQFHSFAKTSIPKKL